MGHPAKWCLLSTWLDLLEVAVPEVVHHQVVALRPLGAIMRVVHRRDGHLHEVAAVCATIVLGVDSIDIFPSQPNFEGNFRCFGLFLGPFWPF